MLLAEGDPTTGTLFPFQSLSFFAKTAGEMCKGSSVAGGQDSRCEALKVAMKCFVTVGSVLESVPILAEAEDFSGNEDMMKWSNLVRAKVAGQKQCFNEAVLLCEKHTHDEEAGFYAAYLMGFSLMKLKKFLEAASVLDKALTQKSDQHPAALLKKIGEVAKACHDKAEDRALIFKFPRTHHICDAGGNTVTRYDLLLETRDTASYLNSLVFVEEKIDGANLWIWLDTDYTVRCQNS
eukprot:3680820-Rhodomonas_salina.2